MSKFLSLLKANLSEGIDVFNYHVKSASNLKRYGIVLVFMAMIMFAVGSMTSTFLSAIESVGGGPEIILPLVVAVVSMMLLIEGIHKSGELLFESRDNNMLLAMPISKKTILFLRFFKFLLFEFLYGALFFIPAIIVYAIHIKPQIDFYLAAVIMLFLVAILPTVIAGFLGYFVKLIASKVRAKKLISTIFTAAAAGAVFLIVFILSSSNNDAEVVSSISNLGNTTTNFYYPAKAFLALSQSFNFGIVISLVLINLVPLVLFILLGGAQYFKIIAKLSEHAAPLSKKSTKIKSTSKMVALVKRELHRFFSITSYLLNSSFSCVLIVVITGYLCINHASVTEIVAQISSSEIGEIINLTNLIPYAFCILIIFASWTSCLTASSISLEGHSMDLTKSLPISTREFFLSKVLFSDVVIVPVILICDIFFFLFFTPALIDIILILLFTFIMPTASALFGLIVNLKLPKLKYDTDAEVIKQSSSSLICTFGGIGVSFLSVILIAVLNGNLYLHLFILLGLFIIIAIVLWIMLCTYGERRWLELES